MATSCERRCFTVNDLPAYSRWPARLLGLEPWQPKQKSASEVVREFEHDKWGVLLSKAKAAGPATTIQQVDRWAMEGVQETLCSDGESFELLSGIEARRKHLDVVRSVLRRHMPAAALVELGAGYGSVILNLAADPAFSKVALFAGEYVPSGVELIRRLAAAQNVSVTAGSCDLSSAGMVDFAVPTGAVWFTCMAAHYVPLLTDRFVEKLAEFRPAVVVNIEPCYEHCDPRTLIGALRRRYIEVNDYNRNLVTILHRHHGEGDIRIVEEVPAVFGCNPLLPVSVIAWVPQA